LNQRLHCLVQHGYYPKKIVCYKPYRHGLV